MKYTFSISILIRCNNLDSFFNRKCMNKIKELLTINFQSFNYVWLFATSWTAAHWSSVSFTVCWSLLKLMTTESVMPYNHLILCCLLLLLPSTLPSRNLSFLKVYKSTINAHVDVIKDITGQWESIWWGFNNIKSHQASPLGWDPKDTNLIIRGRIRANGSRKNEQQVQAKRQLVSIKNTQFCRLPYWFSG